LNANKEVNSSNTVEPFFMFRSFFLIYFFLNSYKFIIQVENSFFFFYSVKNSFEKTMASRKKKKR
jgi:hypothetical protein